MNGIPLLDGTRTWSCCAPSRRPTGSPGCGSVTRSATSYLLDAARAAAIPLSVTEPAQRAAIAALDHEPELLERVASICAQRDALWQALIAQGWDIPKPQGNFVWLATGEQTAEAAEILLRTASSAARSSPTASASLSARPNLWRCCSMLRPRL